MSRSGSGVSRELELQEGVCRANLAILEHTTGESTNTGMRKRPLIFDWRSGAHPKRKGVELL